MMLSSIGKKLQALKRLQAEAGGESERFAERIEKTRRALARAIRQAERYGIEVGSAAAERRAADEAARHEAALARIERRRRNREVRRETSARPSPWAVRFTVSDACSRRPSSRSGRPYAWVR